MSVKEQSLAIPIDDLINYVNAATKVLKDGSIINYVESISPPRKTSEILDHIENALEDVFLLKEKEKQIKVLQKKFIKKSKKKDILLPFINKKLKEKELEKLKSEKKKIYSELEKEIKYTHRPELDRITKNWTEEIFSSKLDELETELKKTKDNLNKIESDQQNALLSDINMYDKFKESEFIYQKLIAKIHELEKCLEDLSSVASFLKEYDNLHHDNAFPFVPLIVGGVMGGVLGAMCATGKVDFWENNKSLL